MGGWKEGNGGVGGKCSEWGGLEKFTELGESVLLSWVAMRLGRGQGWRGGS